MRPATVIVTPRIFARIAAIVVVGVLLQLSFFSRVALRMREPDLSTPEAQEAGEQDEYCENCGRPMVLNATQGSYTIKLAPTLKQYANQWEFAPDIENNGPDEGSADSCNAAPYTGCLSVFPLTSYSFWDDRFASVAAWQPYGGPGGFNDYDSIEVGDGSADSGLSLAASETQLSLWSLASAPLILGSDLTSKVTNAYGTSASLTRRDLKLVTNAQVIKNEGCVLPGLYAAGETVGLYNGRYPGATSVLRGAVFGRKAGEHAATSR